MDETLDEIMEDTGLAQKWREEERQELVTNALSRGKSIEDISDFMGLDTKTVQEIASKWECGNSVKAVGN